MFDDLLDALDDMLSGDPEDVAAALSLEAALALAILEALED